MCDARPLWCAELHYREIQEVLSSFLVILRPHPPAIPGEAQTHPLPQGMHLFCLIRASSDLAPCKLSHSALASSPPTSLRVAVPVNRAGLGSPPTSQGQSLVTFRDGFAFQICAQSALPHPTPPPERDRSIDNRQPGQPLAHQGVYPFAYDAVALVLADC